MGGVVLAGINRDVNSIAATEAIPALIVLIALSLAAAFVLARRPDASRSTLEWFAGLSTLALIVAVTMFRGEVDLGFRIGGLFDWPGAGLHALSRDPLGSSQFLLNVALFVPAGAVWTWLTNRAVRVAGALVAGSFVIECVQAVTGAGVNDLVDIVSNSAGAAIGAGSAAAVVLAAGRNDRTWSPRTRAQVLAGTLVATVILATIWFAGASSRQSSVANALEDRFAGTTRPEIMALIETDFEAVYSAVETRADGVQYFDDAIAIRYPATFFSLHRCVYVTWTDEAMSLRKASGDDCTQFLG